MTRAAGEATDRPANSKPAIRRSAPIQIADREPRIDEVADEEWSRGIAEGRPEALRRGTEHALDLLEIILG